MKVYYPLGNLFILSLSFPLSLSNAHADQYVVTQNNLQFSHGIEVIKTNDIVTFRNEDDIIHNNIGREYLLNAVKNNFCHNIYTFF